MPVAICAEFQVGVPERPDVTREYKSQCYAFGPLAGDTGPNASWLPSQRTMMPRFD